MPKKFTTVVVIVLLFSVISLSSVIVVLAESGYIDLENRSEGEIAADSYCKSVFGEEWEYQGYMIGDPPVIDCVNGDHHGYVEMPKSIASHFNITAASYQDNESRVGYID